MLPAHGEHAARTVRQALGDQRRHGFRAAFLLICGFLTPGTEEPIFCRRPGRIPADQFACPEVRQDRQRLAADWRERRT